METTPQIRSKDPTSIFAPNIFGAALKNPTLSAPAPLARAAEAGPRMGLYEGLPIEVYHSDEALSNGGAGEILRSPSHYIASRLRPRKPKDFQDFGTAVHFASLEPKLFYERFLKKPDIKVKTEKGEPAKLPWSTKEGKAILAELSTKNPGKILVDGSDFEAIERIIEVVYSHPIASQYLSAKGLVEPSYFWKDSEFEERCRARPDKVLEGGLITVELKTTRDAEPEKFNKFIFDYAYPRQGAFQHEGILQVTGKQPERHIVIAVEHEDPYGITCWDVSKKDLERGHEERRNALQLFSNCRKTDAWPGYFEHLYKTQRPGYMK